MAQTFAAGEQHKHVATHGMSAYRAPSLTQPHNARQALLDAHNGKIQPLIGYYLGICTVPTARCFAQIGADVIWVDWEHSAIGIETMTEIVHAIQFFSEGRTIPFVRVPGHDHATIAFALDAGASVIVPQVDTVEQAKHICAATKFGKAARGNRSAPPFRHLATIGDGVLDADKSIWMNLNQQAALIIQIESATGLSNLDAILAECGDQIDGVWMGQLDLRVSMGLDGLWGPEPEYVEAVRYYEETLQKHNIPNTGVVLNDWPKSKGKSFVIVGGDGFLLPGEKALVASARTNIAELRKESSTAETANSSKNGLSVEIRNGSTEGIAAVN